MQYIRHTIYYYHHTRPNKTAAGPPTNRLASVVTEGRSQPFPPILASVVFTPGYAGLLLVVMPPHHKEFLDWVSIRGSENGVVYYTALAIFTDAPCTMYH